MNKWNWYAYNQILFSKKVKNETKGYKDEVLISNFGIMDNLFSNL